jgi:hypothetical protein
MDKVAVQRMIMPMAAIFLQTRNSKETITVFESEVGQGSVLTIKTLLPPKGRDHAGTTCAVC